MCKPCILTQQVQKSETTKRYMKDGEEEAEEEVCRTLVPTPTHFDGPPSRADSHAF